MTDGPWGTVTRLCATTLVAGVITLVVTISPSWERLTIQTPNIPLPPVSEPPLPLSMPLQAFSQVTERPLFNNDRRPDPAPVALEAARKISLSNYRLAGIVTSGAIRVALIEQRGAAKPLKLMIGDSLDGRTVKEIRPSGVIFDGQGDEALEFPKIQHAGPKADHEANIQSGSPSNGDVR